MNTLEQLLDNGIELHTAVSMLESYSEKIGTMNGIYEITDIDYDFKERGKDVTLRCTQCGIEIHRIMISGRNKWSELIKSCPCEKEAKRKAELEKISESKKALIRELKSRIGMVFEDYKIVSIEDLEGRPKYTLKCTICGAEKIVIAYPFTAKDFKCTKHYEIPIKFDESYIGRINNYLKVIDIVRNDKGIRKFLCECTACENRKLIELVNWEDGTVKSCGCMHDKLLSTHGLSKTRLYSIWSGMKQRCYNHNSIGYDNYGGRGILICNEWLGENGLFNFIDWANSHGYSDDLTIDRIDVNGNYEPGNCRWADWDTQIENRRPSSEWKKRKKRKCKIWTIDGVTKPRKEWCVQYDTSLEAVKYRVNHMGMTLYDALTTPKTVDGRPRKCDCQ